MGVPSSGFCQSFVDQLESICALAHCKPVWPWTFYSDLSLPLTVSDDTVYCRNKFSVQLSGIFESVNLFSLPLSPDSDCSR